MPFDLKRWALAALATFALSWFVFPVQSPVGLVAAKARDAWALPAMPQRMEQASVAVIVASAEYWGIQSAQANAAPAVEEPIKVDPRWRIAAVFGNEVSRRVLVTFSDSSKANQLLTLGDALPSGHRITRIDERHVCVAIGRKSYILPIERLDTAQ